MTAPNGHWPCKALSILVNYQKLFFYTFSNYLIIYVAIDN